MIVFPTFSHPLPIRQGYGVEIGTGLARHEMTGAHARRERAFAHLPMAVTATWALTRAERAELVAFMDATGTAEFWTPLRVPGDPRNWRSVLARWASGLDIAWRSPARDNVSATLTVLHVPVILNWGALLSPDGSPIVAPSGADVHYEERG